TDAHIDGEVEAAPSRNSTAKTPEERAREDYASATNDQPQYAGKFSEKAFIERYQQGQYFDLDARAWRRKDSDHFKFADDVATQAVFDDLTTDSVFGRYWGKLEQSGLFDRSKLMALLDRILPGGKSRAQVRKAFRTEVEPVLLEAMLDRKALQEMHPDLDWTKD